MPPFAVPSFTRLAFVKTADGKADVEETVLTSKLSLRARRTIVKWPHLVLDIEYGVEEAIVGHIKGVLDRSAPLAQCSHWMPILTYLMLL